MSNNHIILANYNSHLISRMHGRSIFDDLIKAVDKGKPVLFDFNNVSVVTLSFATELFSNVNKNKLKVEIIHANQFVQETLDFAFYSEENKNLQF